MNNNSFNKKLAELIGKMDEKVLQAKLNTALDMLKKVDTDELAKKINKMDKDELISKINEFDDSKIKDMNINLEEVKKRVTEEDLRRLQKLIGEQGDEIVKKIKDIIK